MDTRTRLADRWPDGVNLLIGLWLVISPFILGFGEYTAAAVALCGFGAFIVLFAVLSLTRPESWEEGVNIIVGLCLAVSPWLFGFAAGRTLTLNALIGGFLVVALAVWSMLRSMPGDHWWHHTHHGSR